MAKNNKGVKAGLGALAGAATLGAAAAGYYFYASKDSKKNRHIAARWASNLKNDVVKQGKKLKSVDQKTLLKLVNSAAQTYYGARNMDRREIDRAAKELKDNWRNVMTEVTKGAASAKKSVKKAVKNTAKKAKKATKRGK